jgi:Glycosyl transferases group 1
LTAPRFPLQMDSMFSVIQNRSDQPSVVSSPLRRRLNPNGFVSQRTLNVSRAVSLHMKTKRDSSILARSTKDLQKGSPSRPPMTLDVCSGNGRGGRLGNDGALVPPGSLSGEANSAPRANGRPLRVVHVALQLVTGGMEKLLVLPSLTEGISLTLMEAMARGLPVVATRVGGNPEVVDEGRTGLLVPERSPVELASALLRLIRDPETGRRMGLEGRHRVEQYFDVRRMVAQYERLYLEPRPQTSEGVMADHPGAGS